MLCKNSNHSLVNNNSANIKAIIFIKITPNNTNFIVIINEFQNCLSSMMKYSFEIHKHIMI